MKDLINQISKHKQERAMKIGKAKYGITKKNYFKLKDGDSKFRILPPMGDNADKGIWSVFYKVHYGYKNSKGKLRVFQSSLVVNRKTKMVEVPDAAVERIESLKAKLEEAKVAGNKQVVEKLGKLVSGQKPQYNIDSNHYMNVIDDQGNIGVLKLRHRAKTALEVQIKKLREKGIDPLSVDNGRYFVFTRSGSGLDTSFQVEILKKDIEVAGVGMVQQEVVHKLNDELIGRLSDEAVDLSKIFKALTAEEIARVVKASDLMTGQSPVIDELFDTKGGGDDSAGDDGIDPDEEPASGTGSSTSAATAAAPAAAAAAAAPVAQPAPVQAAAPAPAPVAAVQAAPAPAPVQAAPVATPAPAALPKTTSETVSDMSDDDFLKSLGLN